MSIDEWDWSDISYHIPMEDVIKYPNEEWDKIGLSYNCNISMEVVKKDLPNSTNRWRWYAISRFVRTEDVINYPNEKWHRGWLSMNKNIDIDILIHRIQLPSALGRWIRPVSPDIIKDKKESTYDILSIVKEGTRRSLSNNKDISMYWIRFKDRVGLDKCRWDCDLSIVCSD
jgi:hypothetical protein